MSSNATNLARDLRHALDPVVWAKEVLGFTCDPWQAKMLRSASRQVILNCCRQSGKSTVTAILAAHTAIFNSGSLILLFSPTQRQSAELYAKVADCFRRMKSPPALQGDNLTSCALANGSRIKSLPGEAHASRGFSAPSLVLIDEGAYTSDELVQAIRPMMSVGQGRLFMMSTPAGRRGAFFHAWNDPSGDWAKVFVPASECPRISTAFLDTERATVGDWIFSQEYEGQFLDSSGQLFSSQHIEAALLDRPWLPLRLTHAVRETMYRPQAQPAEDAEMPGDQVGYIVGLDIGQARDYSAICVLEHRVEIEREIIPARPNPLDHWQTVPSYRREKEITHGHIVFMARFILGTPYPQVVEDVAQLLGQLSASWGEPPALWIDASGVGRGLLDMFDERDVKARGVTLTGGHEVTVNSRRDIRVPKARIVNGIQLALQTFRLKVAAGIPALPSWISEMEGFTAKISAGGTTMTEAFSQAVHDDLVIATGLALWGAEHPSRPPRLVML